MQKHNLIMAWAVAIIFLIIFLIHSNFAAALNATFDPANPADFDYDNGDYSLITDWNVVSWEKIPPSRISDVPTDELDYEKLQQSQRMGMTAGQIAKNLEKISNLRLDVDIEQAEMALHQTFGVRVELDHAKAASVNSNILEGGDEEDKITLTNPLYKTGKLVVYHDRIIFIPEKDGQQITPVENDHFLLDTGEKTAVFKGHIIKGKLYFDSQNTYLGIGDRTIINGVQVWYRMASSVVLMPGEERLGIFFDEKPHKGDHISFTKASLVFEKGDNDAIVYTLDFLEGNTYIPVSEDQAARLSIDRNMNGILQQREGLPPLLVLEDKKTESHAYLMNGELYFTFKDGEHHFSKTGMRGKKTAPFSVMHYTEDGTSLLGTKEHPAIMIFDKDNSFYILPEQFYEDKGTTPEIAYDYVSQQILTTGNINKFSSTVGKDAKVLAALLLNLQGLSSHLLDSIEGIRIVTDEELKVSCGGINVGGCTLGQTIIIPPDVSFTALSHEAAHVHQHRIENEAFIANEQPLKEYELRLMHKYSMGEFSKSYIVTYAYGDNKNIIGERVCLEPICLTVYSGGKEVQLSDEDAVAWLTLRQQTEDRWRNGLSYRWMDIAKNKEVYGKHLEEVSEGELQTKWDDGTDGPRHGCVKAYGCRNDREDIATFTEIFATNNYDFFGDYQLIQPPGHPDHDPQKYDTRYKQKLDLLLEYNFITQEDYDKIFEGVK